MSQYIIRYRAFDDVETERCISDIELENGVAVNAFCHLRQERRSFVLLRILHAVLAETGEVIDLAAHFGVKRPRPPTPPAILRTQAQLQLLKRGSEEYKRQRNLEKRELRKPFGIEPVYEHFKGLLFGLFEHRCAKCCAPARLDLDHHVPMVLGGRLVPGNIGALCRRCNNAKGDRAPADFYREAELQRIEPLLRQEVALFDFTFDWRRWRDDRQGYLLSIGLAAQLVNEIFANPNHRWHVDQESEIAVRFVVENLDEVIDSNGALPSLRKDSR